MENITVVTFNANHKKNVLCCYTNKTNEEIHDQLTGWDRNYQLLSVIRLDGAIDTNFLSNAANENDITVVFYNVMDWKHTEVFYHSSDLEIKEILDERDFESYLITAVIHSDKFSFDALNSITRYKDTD